jgi:hypothetical protein
VTARRRPRPGPAPRPWQPLTRATWVTSPSQAAFRSDGRSLAARAEANETWLNDQYTVIVERREDGTVEHLSIRRADRGPARDWRDFQRIKDQLAGPDVEAVELYPARARVVDTANQFHLWCLRPGRLFPLGWTSGVTASGADLAGAVQRPLETD